MHEFVLNSSTPSGCSLPLGMPFVEIVRTESTLPQVIIDLMNFGRKMKKTPLVASERKGYSVNCMFITYLLAAILLAERGVDVYQIDQALKSFGMQFGPFRYTYTICNSACLSNPLTVV